MTAMASAATEAPLEISRARSAAPERVLCAGAPATSQQYPLKMASEGVKAIVDVVRNNAKVSGYHDTGVNLITAKPMKGVPSKNVKYGLANCWG